MKLKYNTTKRLKTIIIIGEVGAGKTTCIQNLIEKLHNENIKVHGIYSPRLMENKKTTGYDVVNIFSGEKQTFLRISGNVKQQRIGKFYMYSEGLCLGKSALQLNTFAPSGVIIIDEIGRLELTGKGWHDSLQNLVQHFNGYLLLSVRKDVVNEIIQQYDLKPESILEVSKSICDDLSRLIIKKKNGKLVIKR